MSSVELEKLNKMIEEENNEIDRLEKYKRQLREELKRVERTISVRIGRIQILSELIKEEKQNEQASAEVHE